MIALKNENKNLKLQLFRANNENYQQREIFKNKSAKYILEIDSLSKVVKKKEY